MPETSRFFGIIIFMYFNEHYPPHFMHSTMKARRLNLLASLSYQKAASGGIGACIGMGE